MKLTIKQSNTPEIVTSELIDGLYNLSSDGNLTNDSELEGNLQATAAYEDSVTYLTSHYPRLTINAASYYIRFNDEYVLATFLDAGFGDGAGITTATARDLNFGNIFVGNTQIRRFNEYSKFTSQQARNTNFSSCSNLVSIDLTNITVFPCFNGCSNLEYFYGENSEAGLVDLTGISELASNSLRSCPKVKKMIMDRPVTFGWYSFNNYSLAELHISKIEDFLNSVSGDGVSLFASNSKIYINGEQLTDLVIPQTVSTTNMSLQNLTLQWLTLDHPMSFTHSRAWLDVSGMSGVKCDSINTWLSCVFSGEYSCPLFYGKHLYINNQVVSSVTIGVLNNRTEYDHVFDGCTDLTSVTIQEGIRAIGGFRNCSNLVSVQFPTTTLEKIYGNAFSKCSQIQNMTLPSSVKYVGGGAFHSSSGWSTLVISSNVISVGNSAWQLAVGLSRIEWYSQQTTVPFRCFYSCSASVVIIGEGVTIIDGEAFHGSWNLEYLELPSTIATISSMNFQNSRIITLICKATIPPVCKATFDTSRISIYVPDDNISDYEAHEDWAQYTSYFHPLSQAPSRPS